jgi:plasmid maintenance system antidote protein VapI
MSASKNYLTTQQMIKVIEDMVDQHGSQKAVAEVLDITPSYLSDILQGSRGISEKLARKIGYIRETVFKPTGDA